MVRRAAWRLGLRLRGLSHRTVRRGWSQRFIRRYHMYRHRGLRGLVGIMDAVCVNVCASYPETLIVSGELCEADASEVASASCALGR
eukprot:1282541-Prymnesium_polylepis.2